MTREEKEYIFHNMRNAVVQPSEPMNLEEMRAYINRSEERRVGKSVSVRVVLGGRRII